MDNSSPLSAQEIETWLAGMGISHYVCDHCSALHLSGGESVAENRLFIEEWGLLVSTEFHIRPTALLRLVADMGQLNVNYPTIKLFVDIVDDAVPQLVAGTTVLTGAGLSPEQFALFISSSMEMLADLAADLQEMDCLYMPDTPPEAGSRQLH